MATTLAEPTRIIGIRHRRKRTTEGEARPTAVAILSSGQLKEIELETEDDERDFLLGLLPQKWRPIDPTEAITWFEPKTQPDGVHSRHCKWRKVKVDEDTSTIHPSHIRTIEDPQGRSTTRIVDKVPTQFEGFRANDAVSMILGGSGDSFAAALSRRGEDIKAHGVFRLTPAAINTLRGTADKEQDHITLTQLFIDHQRLFYHMRRRDRDTIRVKEALKARQSAQKDRIACEQRIYATLVGRIFLNEEGYFPEGVIKAQFDLERANDRILQGLIAEEERRDKELKKAVHRVEIWNAFFKDVQGCGERIAAGLISAASDIRRFMIEPDPLRMAELKVQCNRFEQEGQFREDLPNVIERVNKDTTRFQKIQMVRSWQRANGKETEACLLDQAIACHQERARMRRRALRKGQDKFRHFCGTFVKQGGVYGDQPRHLQFPRRRTGENGTWHPVARQALYLLGDQFNRRPESCWGKRMLANKAAYQRKHPEEQTEEVTLVIKGRKKTVPRQIYTPGHLHRMGLWKTASDFVASFYTAWVTIEKKHQRNGQATPQNSEEE